MSEGKLYADRDPCKLEPHYSRHISAMTSEGLHGKSDIAAELAWRDQLLDEMAEALGFMRDAADRLVNPPQHQSSVAALETLYGAMIGATAMLAKRSAR